MNDEWETVFNDASRRVCEYMSAAMKHDTPLAVYCEFKAYEAALDMTRAYAHMTKSEAEHAIEKAS